MARALRSLFLAALVTAALVVVGATISPAADSSAPAVPRTRLASLPAGTAPRPVPFPASHLGARWQGSEEAVVELRSAGASGWGPWGALSVAHDLDDEERGFTFSGLVRIDGAERVQARVGPGVHGLELVVIDASSATVPVAAPGPRGLITRAGWGADESIRKGPPEYAPPVKFIVHHTVTPNDDPDPASTVRAIYAYHVQSRGWNDIGYNFLVDAAGRIYEGRFARPYAPDEVPTGEDESGRGVIGAHARGFNQGSFGVSMLGDFSGGTPPTPAAVDSLVRVLAWKAGGHGIDPEASDSYTAFDGSTSTFPNIAGHRDVGQTACPGDRLYDLLPELRHRVKKAIPPSAPSAPGPGSGTPPPAPPSKPDIPGFWTAAGDGHVRAFGDAPAAGDLGTRPLAAPIVALAASPSGKGYWLAGADGGVFAFGDARFFGSATGQLSSPAVHLEPTPGGGGYWVVASGGEVLSFGDAGFYGSTAHLPLEIAGMAATPGGSGYWLAAADGRVFAFGDALERSLPRGRLASEVTGAVRPSAPIVSIAAHPDGQGFWLLGQDGGVFAFDVPFHGSLPARGTTARAVQLRVTETGNGYYIAGDDGAVFAFGDADRRRERLGQEAGVVDLALRPAPAGYAAAPASSDAPAPPASPALPAPDATGVRRARN